VRSFAEGLRFALNGVHRWEICLLALLRANVQRFVRLETIIDLQRVGKMSDGAINEYL
jgi:hypothetical protein